MIDKKQLQMIKTIWRPWKRSIVETDYEKGWNDAIKEMDKNYKKFMKEFYK